MTISIDVEQALHKNLYCFMINTFNNLGIGGNFLDPTKSTSEKAIVSITRKGRRTKAVSLPLKMRGNRMPVLTTSFDIVLKVLAEQLGKKRK